MKKDILFTLSALFFLLPAGQAQKKAAFFLSPEANYAATIGETRLETSEYMGFHTDNSRLESLGLVRNNAKRAYGLGVMGGIVYKGRLYLSTGIRYHRRQDWGIFYCHVCDFFPSPSPQKIRLDLYKIPVRARFDLLKGEGLRPFLSAEGFHSRTLKTMDSGLFSPLKLQQWGYRLGAGLAYPFGDNVQVHFQFFYEQDLDWGKEYPHYHYQSLGFTVGATFVAR